jgi:hypothetical protein
VGNELTCKLRYGGKSLSGKALLETSEIFFRGDQRLKIPFSTITGLHSQDGQLHVHTEEGQAIFELGPQAAKWHHKIANPKSLLDKLGVKPGESVSLVGDFPPDFLAGLKKHKASVTQYKRGKETPWIFLAADLLKALRRLPAIADSMRGAAALWVVYPKGQKSIKEHDVRSSGLKAGLVDVKVASFSATHTALKFVIPKSRR